jgi:hypothetical protein
MRIGRFSECIVWPVIKMEYQGQYLIHSARRFFLPIIFTRPPFSPVSFRHVNLRHEGINESICEARM